MKLKIFAAIAAALSVTGGAVALTGATAQKSDPSRLTLASNPAEREAALERFATLRGQDGAVPAATTERLRKLLPFPRELDPGKTRLSRSGADGSRVHLLAGPDAICVVIEERSGSGSGGCGDPASAAEGRRLSTSVDKVEDGWRVTALVPDGISGVEVQRADGISASLTVSRNIATGVVSNAPRGIAWVDASLQPAETRFRGLTG